MSSNPACQTFIPMLSPFIDGELSPAERMTVERHLVACQQCAMRAADLRAESGLVRVGMEMAADEVDFKDFAQKVLARITPERPPLLERIRLSVSELFTYHRGMMVTSLATAAAVLLLALPLIMRGGTPAGYASQRLEVQAVSIDESAHVAPVVMETESGDTIIWTVEHTHEKPGVADEERQEELDVDPDADRTKPRQDAPTGGEL
ncbi:MAG: zf-HC2 domain-containing protein [Myxococcales bacterium]|nr:zf-HC2 domain-containing protein [Myxococcales bacterium]